FIVGFPGETDEDFELLLDWLEEAELDRVGCFTYSAVDGAPANDLPDPVPEEVAAERLERFMNVQARISARRLARKVGRDIDGLVYLNGETDLTPGQRVWARVEHSDEHDLWASLVDKS